MTTATNQSKADAGIGTERLLHMYKQMVSIRLFEEQVNDLYTRALMPGLAHLYIGEEAVAVGICEALHRDDYITSTHRGHGHCLAKGAAPDRMFAELLGKEAGYCRGKGGSMHIADPKSGNLGANAIVGGSVGIAAGAAFSAKTLGTKQVAVCFFGEGALGQGLLYEVMNLSRLWDLPVIYVCENNMYNEYTHFSETTAGDILARPAAFGIPGESVDGQDVRAVYSTASRLVDQARSGIDARRSRPGGAGGGDAARSSRMPDRRRCGRGRHAVQSLVRARGRVRKITRHRYADLRGRIHGSRGGSGDDGPSPGGRYHVR